MLLARHHEGQVFVQLGRSSSDLSREEMSDLIELIAEWGARNGIEFGGEREAGSAEEAPAASAA